MKKILQTPTEWIPLEDLDLLPEDVLLYIHAVARPDIEVPEDFEFVTLGFRSSASGALIELPTMVSIIDTCVPDFYHVVYNPKGVTISVAP